MKKLLGIVVLGLLWFMPVNADNHCPDKNPEIILDLGGTPEPEKIVYDRIKQKYPNKLKAKRVIHSIHSKVKFSRDRLKELIIDDDTHFI